MPRSFLVTPGAPAAVTYVVEASADGLTEWATTDTIDAAALVDLLDGSFRLDAALSPTDQYARLIPADKAPVGGVFPVGTLFGAPNRTYPPHATDTATFTVEVDTVDGGMGIVAGLEFSSTPKAVLTGAGIKTATGQAITTTAADGTASLTLPADAGIFVLRLGRGSVEIDTAGRGATTVNFADLLP
jgi:hypothetical protein